MALSQSGTPPPVPTWYGAAPPRHTLPAAPVVTAAARASHARTLARVALGRTRRDACAPSPPYLRRFAPQRRTSRRGRATGAKAIAGMKSNWISTGEGGNELLDLRLRLAPSDTPPATLLPVTTTSSFHADVGAASRRGPQEGFKTSPPPVRATSS